MENKSENLRLQQPCSPSDDERHAMLEYALKRAHRLEELDEIIETLSPPENIMDIESEKSLNNKRIGIIGGGLSGMAAAFELRKRGADVTIFEAEEKRIGGRVYTHYFDEKNSVYGELGAMRVPISHECTWKYINLFKLKTRPFVNTNENAFIYVRCERIKNDSKGINVKKYIYPHFNMDTMESRASFSELAEFAFSGVLNHINTEDRKDILSIKETYPKSIERWSSFNQVQALKRVNLSNGAIQCIGSVENHFGALYNTSNFELLQGEYSMNHSFAYEIEGGMTKLPQALYTSLNKKFPREYKDIPIEKIGKCTWLKGTKVRKIIFHKTHNKIEIRTERKSMEFDFVVCAIPFGCLRNIEIIPCLSSEKMTAIRDIVYVSAFKAIFLCKKRFWEEGKEFLPIVGGSSNTDLTISTIWYPSDNARMVENNDESARCIYSASIFDKWECAEKEKSKGKGVLVAAYGLALDANRIGGISDDEKFELIKRQVEKVHGLPEGYMDDIVEDYKFMYWPNNPNSLGAFSHYVGDQKVDLSYAAYKSEYNETLYFAGEHICQSHGWMQSAIQSGMIAANEIVKHSFK